MKSWDLGTEFTEDLERTQTTVNVKLKYWRDMWMWICNVDMWMWFFCELWNWNEMGDVEFVMLVEETELKYWHVTCECGFEMLTCECDFLWTLWNWNEISNVEFVMLVEVTELAPALFFFWRERSFFGGGRWLWHFSCLSKKNSSLLPLDH